MMGCCRRAAACGGGRRGGHHFAWRPMICLTSLACVPSPLRDPVYVTLTSANAGLCEWCAGARVAAHGRVGSIGAQGLPRIDPAIPTAVRTCQQHVSGLCRLCAAQCWGSQPVRDWYVLKRCPTLWNTCCVAEDAHGRPTLLCALAPSAGLSSLTWLLPERFSEGELSIEALHTALGLLSGLHDTIVSSSPGAPPPPGATLALALSTLEQVQASAALGIVTGYRSFA